MIEISKSQLVALMESDDSLEFMGRATLNAEDRIYYRTRWGAAGEPRGWRIVYTVVS